MTFTEMERKLVIAAFQRAWKILLREQRVTAKNIERVPKVLLSAIVAAVQKGQRDALRLATAAVAEMDAHERAQLERARRRTPGFKTLH